MRMKQRRHGNRIRRWLIMLVFILLALPVSASETAEDAKTEAVQENRGLHQTKDKKYYYILADGRRAVGWNTINDKTYYFDRNGLSTVGWKKLGGKYYYFNQHGVQQTGWITVKKSKYYMDPQKNGARTVGWKKIDKHYYYFNEKGQMQTGWLKLNKKYYYLNSKGQRARGWTQIGKKKYYFDKKTGERAKGWKEIEDYSYYFLNNGTLLKNSYTKDGSYVDAEGKKLKKSTLKEFLQIALQPVGSTMYVWGGGWNAADNGGNIDARTIGVSPQWKRFFNQQNSGYDYRTTRYQNRNGLDCSGYVGWTIYNAFNTKSGNSGYVCLAQQMTRAFSSKGWGTYTAAGAVKNYRAGDIMSTSDGHVYIVIGSCSDGSVVLVHSSPQGVQINGTCTPSGNARSKAVKLAEKYMKQYYPKWYAKFPDCSRGSSYLTRYSRMRWKLTGNCMMSDPDNYSKKNAAQVLKDLFR